MHVGAKRLENEIHKIFFNSLSVKYKYIEIIIPANIDTLTGIVRWAFPPLFPWQQVYSRWR